MPRSGQLSGVILLLILSTVIGEESAGVDARNPLPPPGLTGHIIIASNGGEVMYDPTKPSNYHSMITTGMISELLVDYYGEPREVVEDFIDSSFGLNFTTMAEGDDYELKQYRMKYTNNVRAYVATSPCSTPQEGYSVHEYGWLFRVTNGEGIPSPTKLVFYPYNTAIIYSWLIVNTGNTTCPPTTGLLYPQTLRFHISSNVPLYLQTNPEGPLIFDMKVEGQNETANFYDKGEMIGAINPALNGDKLQTTTIYYLLFKDNN